MKNLPVLPNSEAEMSYTQALYLLAQSYLDNDSGLSLIPAPKLPENRQMTAEFKAEVLNFSRKWRINAILGSFKTFLELESGENRPNFNDFLAMKKDLNRLYLHPVSPENDLILAENSKFWPQNSENWPDLADFWLNAIDYSHDLARSSQEMTVILKSSGNPDLGQYTPISPRHAKVVMSLEDASKKCIEYIEKYNLGGGNWTGGQVFVDGKQVAEVSYNGKIFMSG